MFLIVKPECIRFEISAVTDGLTHFERVRAYFSVYSRAASVLQYTRHVKYPPSTADRERQG